MLSFIFGLGAPLEILNVRDNINNGRLLGPRMFVSGPWITRSGRRFPSHFQRRISSPEEAAEQANDLIDSGVDLIIPFGKSPRKDLALNLSKDHSVTQPQAGIYFTKPDNYYPNRFQTLWTQGQDEDARYYFPCFDKPNFKQTTEVILHLPSGMIGLWGFRVL